MALRFNPYPYRNDRPSGSDTAAALGQSIASLGQTAATIADANRARAKEAFALKVQQAQLADTMDPNIYHELFGAQGTPSPAQPSGGFKSLFQNKTLPVGPTIAAAAANDAYPNTTWGRNQIKLLHDNEDRELTRRNMFSQIAERERRGQAVGKAPPAGYEWTTEGHLKAIPGGPAWAKGQAEVKRDEANASARKADANMVIGKIDEALQMVGPMSAGLGSYTTRIPGSPAANLSAVIDSIESSLGLSKLMEMKANSRAGASGLGALSDRELTLLTSAISSLKQSQSQDQLKKGLGKIKTHYQNILAMEEGINPYGNQGGGATDNGDAAAAARRARIAELKAKQGAR